ncbi:helix-turn-helix domain-containing protein [Aerococcaceae bacterium NML160702]|nr:helix-turn-helix domain-containing protein [Aerococcaceae bacterium NML160702]
MKIGARIKSIRKNLGLTQTEFAKKINATLPAVSNWETGRNVPNNERLKAIAKIGDMTVDELLYGSTDEVIQSTMTNLIKDLDKDFINSSTLQDDITKCVKKYSISDTVEISNTANTYIKSLPQNNVELMKKLLEHITDLLKVKSFINDLGHIKTISPYNHLYIRYMATILLKTIKNLKQSNLTESDTLLDKDLQVALLQELDYWKSMQLLDETEQKTPYTDKIDLEAFIKSLEKKNDSIPS